jgi:hypothetical protein
VKRDAAPSWTAPLAPQRAPLVLDRAGRVKLVAETAAALLGGRLPSREAQLFVGGAISAWLAQGGRLERFLQVHQRGSHLTPARLLGLIDDERNETEDEIASESLKPDSENER